MIHADCHLHSHHSGDSDSPMEAMIEAGIAAGLDIMCFTEHNDFDYPEADGITEDMWQLNVDSYLYELISMRERYEGKIKLLFGLELGLQPVCMRQNAVLAKSYDFDFIIGSSHVCDSMDPYFPEFWEGKTEQEALRRYFESELENIKKHSNFDVYGHLDYAVRYAKNKDRDYRYADYSDIIDEILKALIEKGKGIELNTGGIKSGMKDFHPGREILKRYLELGGEILTVGSDAHTPDRVAEHFDRACESLKEIGFRYVAVYEKRNPEFFKL